jgi:ABC-type nitrate/sulfonate/bicarbonate transport system substrate-binding protein
MARLVVGALNISESDIDWQVVGPPPERIERLLAGSIDVSLIRVEEATSLHLDPSNTLHTLLGFAELKQLVPVQPHGVLAATRAFAEENPEAMVRLARGMIRASRALNDNFDVFKRAYDHHVTVPVPEKEVHRIWAQERDSDGFALNGELTDAHWNEEMALFYELYPALARITRNDVIVDRYVTEALAALGIRPGPDAPAC